MAKNSKKAPMADIKKELTERGIEFTEDMKYDELAALLDKREDKSLPKRKVKKLVDGEAIEIPALNPVPVGISTMNDHERRITALEVAAGIKKVEVTEID